jgi:hypothetical protein
MEIDMNLTTSLFVFRAVVTAGLLAACSAAANAAVIAQDCGNLGKTVVGHRNDSQTTSSSTFVPVVGSGFGFKTARNGCVLVTFSAQAFAPIDRLIWVRAVLDGVTEAVDGQVAFVAESHNFATTHSYTFLFPLVAAGAGHSVALQWRSQVAGQTVIIDKFGVEVRHR